MTSLLDVIEARETFILDTPVLILRDIVVALLKKRSKAPMQARMQALVSKRSLPGILRSLESTSFKGKTLRSLLESITIETLPVRNKTRRLHRGGFHRGQFLEFIIVGSIIYIGHEVLTNPSILLEIPSLHNYLLSIPSILLPGFEPGSNIRINTPEKKLSALIKFFASLYFMLLFIPGGGNPDQGRSFTNVSMRLPEPFEMAFDNSITMVSMRLPNQIRPFMNESKSNNNPSAFEPHRAPFMNANDPKSFEPNLDPTAGGKRTRRMTRKFKTRR